MGELVDVLFPLDKNLKRVILLFGHQKGHQKGDKMTTKKIGRPKKKSELRLGQAVRVRLTEDDIKLIQVQAFLNKTSVAEYIRTAAIEKLESRFPDVPDVTAFKKIKGNSSS